MAETQSIAPIGADASELGGSSVFEHDGVVTQHDGIHEAAVGSSLVISRDPRFVGAGFFAGEAPDGLTTVYGGPIPADVFVYWRDPDDPMAQEVLVGATKSAPDGTWRITGLNYNLQYVIRARAQGSDDATVVGAMPSRTDVIAYVNQLVPREDEFGDVDGLTGYVFPDSGLPPFTCEVIQPLPYGLSARVDGRKLLIEGVSTANGLWESVVRVTASNGVWVDVPVQVQIQVLTDPHWGKVVSLLRFNGVDGSTTFSDAKGRVWTPEGGARIDTAYFQFGGSSALFTAGGNIRTDATTDFAFGTGDFTVEAWVRVGAPPGGGISKDRHVFGSFAFDPDMVFFLTNGGNQPALWDSSYQHTSSIGVPTNQWTHVAWSRAAGTLRIFVEGVQGYSSTHSVSFASTATARVGAMNQADRFFNGWMDELRITKGVARYIGNFTPPDRPFPDR